MGRSPGFQRVSEDGADLGGPPGFQRVSIDGAILGRSPPGFQRVFIDGAVLSGLPSISLLPTFWRLVAPTPISLNDGLSFNNNNNNDFLIVWNILI